MKRTKQDMQFMIEFDRANRDYLTSVATFTLNQLVAITSIIIATAALIISIDGLNAYSFGVCAFFVLVLAYFWWDKHPRAMKAIEDSKKINVQLQDILFKLYPEYKNKLH